MPFITEEIWQTLVSRLPHDATRPDSLMIAAYPVSTGFIDAQAEREVNLIIEIVRSVRNARAESKIDPARRIEALVYAENRAAMEPHRRAIETLGKVHLLEVRGPRLYDVVPPGFQLLHIDAVGVDIALRTTVDVDAEKERLEQEKESLQTRIAGLEARLSDRAFLSKAPPPVVDKERGKMADSQTRLRRIDERLAELGRMKS
jgi:valyl-tRNA synthetase